MESIGYFLSVNSKTVQLEVDFMTWTFNHEISMIYPSPSISLFIFHSLLFLFHCLFNNDPFRYWSSYCKCIRTFPFLGHPINKHYLMVEFSLSTCVSPFFMSVNWSVNHTCNRWNSWHLLIRVNEQQATRKHSSPLDECPTQSKKKLGEPCINTHHE